jgi:hypothetical protein
VSIATSDTGAIIGGAVGGGILCLMLTGGVLACLFKRLQSPKAVNDVPLAKSNSNSDHYSHLPLAPAPTLYANGNVNDV